MSLRVSTPVFPQRTYADRIEQQQDNAAIRTARQNVFGFIAQRMPSVAGSVEVANAQRVGDSIVFTLKRVDDSTEVQATVKDGKVELSQTQRMLPFWNHTQQLTAPQAAQALGRVDMYM